MVVFELRVHGYRLLFSQEIPLGKVEGQINSLFVEPRWLGLVHPGQQDAFDPDMGRIFGLTRGNSA